VLLQVLLG
jgi:hypothetical protein